MTVQAVTGGTAGSPTSVTRDGHVTTVLVTCPSNSDRFIRLPSGCLVDDIFEVFAAATNSDAPGVLLASGDTYNGVNVVNAIDPKGVRVRKIDSTRWVAL
jgi:hypothetical protein